MKKVTLEYNREDSTTQWYALSNSTKSADFLTYRNFLETNMENMETHFHSQTNVTVDMFFSEEHYSQFETLYATVQPELNAYNSANGITISKSVSDI